jgi:hypothetical protein
MVDESSKKTGWGKIILAVGGAAAIGLAGYGIYSYAKGQTCSSSPSSPCSPYIQAYKSCLNEYILANQQFLAEDQAAGVGYTVTQKEYLATLVTCMNNASKSIYTQTQSLNLPISEAVIAISAAVAAVIIVRGLYPLYAKLKLNNTSRVSGSDTAAAARQTVLQDAYENGTITPETASDFASDNQTLTQGDIQDTNTFVSNLSNTLTETEAETVTAAAQESVDAVTAAETEVDDELAGLFE